MSRFLPFLLIAAIGCAPQTTPASSAGGGEKAAATASPDGKATYICHMGADCGLSKVAAGEKIPACCGKEMVKADTFTCGSCNKQQIIAVGKPAPQCCGAPAKKSPTP